MALFSKPPAKKQHPPAPRPKVAGSGHAHAGAISAHEVAAQAHHGRQAERPRVEPTSADITVTGASILEWAPSQPAIEVAQANPGLCAVLENAALLYASGQAQQARLLLEQGVQTDHDTKLSPLAWLALFDLLERAGDRAAYDQYALQYVVQFERSPPPWDESARKPAASGPKSGAGGYIAITGRLTAASLPQVESLRKAVAKKVAQARLDLATVAGFDDDGARLLAGALAEARRQGFELALQHPEKLVAALDVAVGKGREVGQGAWLLSMEMLQWLHSQEAFDERAIEFAVAFELSPPSWEPPAGPATARAGSGVADSAPAVAAQDVLAWRGVIAGNAKTQIEELAQFAQGRSIIPLDLSTVERIDFVCAGALLNAVDRVESQRKAVQILGASPIIRALLLLIGISPRHFVRKSS